MIAHLPLFAAFHPAAWGGGGKSSLNLVHPVNHLSRLAVFATALLRAGCHSAEHSGQVPGDANSSQPYGGIAESEVLRLVGTEPFWGGQIAGGTLTYTTPENERGAAIAVRRFAGRNGLSFSGALDGKPVDLSVTPGACSDGMSDRSFPFTVTLQLGAEMRQGCAWSDVHPFTGPAKQ